MAKQLEAHKFSGSFRSLWSRESRSLDMAEYDLCINEWKSVHEKKTVINYVITILLFGAGLWATHEHALFMAVLLLALAANFNRQSSHHALVLEVMDAQRLLAMLINKQSRENEAVKREITGSSEGGPS